MPSEHADSKVNDIVWADGGKYGRWPAIVREDAAGQQQHCAADGNGKIEFFPLGIDGWHSVQLVELAAFETGCMLPQCVIQQVACSPSV